MYGSICSANLWNLVGVASHTIPSFLSRGSFVLAVVLFHMIIRALVLRLLYHRAALSLQKIYRRTTASWVKLKRQIFQQPPLYAMHNGHDDSTRTSCLTLQSLNIELPVSPKFSFGSIDATWTAVILPGQHNLLFIPKSLDFRYLKKKKKSRNAVAPAICIQRFWRGLRAGLQITRRELAVEKIQHSYRAYRWNTRCAKFLSLGQCSAKHVLSFLSDTEWVLQDECKMI